MLSIYVHIPFCVRKCHYCSFYSTVYSRQAAHSYLEGLRAEASRYEVSFKNRVFETVYIGGGTPTVLDSNQLVMLINIIRDSFHISPDAEWTIEANPNTSSISLFSSLREHGINRLSLGVQSFSDEVLGKLGRVHTVRDSLEVFKLARITGFSNIGIDLIYGVPGQTEELWNETVETAVRMRPEHISTYCLSLDNGSHFEREAAHGRFTLPDDEYTAGQYEQAVERLITAGYDHYEISNFSLPGFACRHNTNYWERGEYLGLGPGAWSFISGKRYQTIADIREYASRMLDGRSVTEGAEVLEPVQSANEQVMLGLRMSRGLDLGLYEKEFGPGARQQLVMKADVLKQTGLIEERAGMLRLTRRGFLLTNEAVTRLCL